MSILIKGMEMPKDGAFVEVLIWADGHVTQTGDSFLAENGRHYYQPCDWKYFSAVPVPPHGRLIDADVLEERCRRRANDDWNRHTGTSWGYAYLEFENDVEDAPTIIEAEADE